MYESIVLISDQSVGTPGLRVQLPPPSGTECLRVMAPILVHFTESENLAGRSTGHGIFCRPQSRCSPLKWTPVPNKRMEFFCSLQIPEFLSPGSLSRQLCLVVLGAESKCTVSNSPLMSEGVFSHTPPLSSKWLVFHTERERAPASVKDAVHGEETEF